jgi:hypothetical protein
MEIRTKAKFFELWNAGVLGFKLRTWDTVEAARAANPAPGIIGFRQIGKSGGGKLDIVPFSKLDETADAWRREGRIYMICEAAPDEKGTIQGEICRGPFGWAGIMGFSRGLRMRDAIAQGLLTPRSGAVARALVRRFMSPASLDDLDAILDLYPDAAVEFTCYGDHNFERGRNTIFWEVRNY